MGERQTLRLNRTKSSQHSRFLLVEAVGGGEDVPLADHGAAAQEVKLVGEGV